jgi:solute carrier family 25 (mitochondrial uncoupling protein), member 8/9
MAMMRGEPRMYNGSIDCYKKIVAADGIGGLWTGLGPNVMRNSIINAAELASYDQYKEIILGSGYMKDGVALHLTCASMAGTTACVFGSPVDVLKTRIMNAPTGMYGGPLDCFYQTLKLEGPMAFYKGFVPNCARLASWNCAMFLTLEQIKKRME